MPRVLIFRRDSFCYDSLNVFSERLAKALDHMGVETDFFDAGAEGAIRFSSDNIFEKTKYDAAVAFNAGGQHNSFLDDGSNVFDHYGIPFFNYIVDHPLVHHGNMRSECENYYVVCLDRDHVKYIEDHYPLVKGTFFLPLAGIENGAETDTSYEEFLNRPYDVAFTASFDDFRVLDEEIDGYPRLLKELVNSQIDIMLDNRSMTVEGALKIALESNGAMSEAGISYEDAAVATRITNRWIKAYIREEVMRYLLLAEIPVHIWGTGWDRMTDVDHDLMILHDPVSYDKLPSVCDKSRICFNIMPWFKDGLHDRVPTAMLAGAAVLTDGSRYIDELFTAQGSEENIYTYELADPESLPGILRRMIDSPEELYEVSVRGMSFAKKNMTWDALAAKFYGFITSVRDTDVK